MTPKARYVQIPINYATSHAVANSTYAPLEANRMSSCNLVSLQRGCGKMPSDKLKKENKGREDATCSARSESYGKSIFGIVTDRRVPEG